MLIDWCSVLAMAANCLILEKKSERLSLSSRPVFVPLTVAEDVCGGAGVDERIFLSWAAQRTPRRESSSCFIVYVALKFSWGTFGFWHILLAGH